MKCKTSLYTSSALALSALALVLAVGGLIATVQTAEAQESGALETVVVLGVRGAEQKAIDIKRDAASILDSIAAEDIGKLPDVTISDRKTSPLSIGKSNANARASTPRSRRNWATASVLRRISSIPYERT
jgi:hypothetical protein